MKENADGRYDPARFVPLLRRFFAAGQAKQSRIIRRHPELLSDEIITILADLTRFALATGDDEVAFLFRGMRAALLGLRGSATAPSAHLPTMPADLPAMMLNAVEAMRKYGQEGELPLLKDAISAWNDIVGHPRFREGNPTFRAGVLNDLAVAYFFHYRATGDPSSLTKASSCLERAIATSPEDSPDLADRLSNLGAILSNRYDLRGMISDLERAIELNQRAIAQTPATSPRRSIYLNSLGAALLKRYNRSGDLNNLDGSLDALDSALKGAQISAQTGSEPSADLSLILTNLGNTLRARYKRTAEASDLERACASLERALRLPSSGGAADRPIILSNLASGLRDLYAHTHQLSDLQRSIDLFEQALRLTDPGSHLFRHYMVSLANALGARFDHSHVASDVRKAIDLNFKAISLLEKNSPARAGYLNQLGLNLSRAHQHTGSITYYNDALAAFREAVQAGSSSNLEDAVDSARSWADFAFLAGHWTEAAEGYEVAFGLSQRLLELHVARGQREVWLRESQNLGDRGAYALAMVGDLKQAASALERSHARLLGIALGKHRRDLEQLGASEHVRQYQELQESADRWSAMAAPAPEGVDPDNTPREGTLRAAEEEFKNMLTKIRKLPGFERFLVPPDFDCIARATDTCSEPLVYLAVTAAGGLGLICTAESTVTPVWLPKLTYDAVVDQLFGGDTDEDVDMEKCMSAYLLWRKRPTNKERERLWFEALECTTEWLWEALIGPLLAALAPAVRAIIVPSGVLGLLPLHTAWTEDSTMPSGRSYALDRIVFSIVPSAFSLLAAKEIAAHAHPEEVLVVSDPYPTLAPLPFASLEARMVRNTFHDGLIVEHENATRSAVLPLIQDHSVIHFACHAFANLYDPQQSGLVMANSEVLSLGDIFTLKHKDRRLAVLSACETSLAGLQLPDETVSLPTGLLGVGVAGIVASLWSVADLSTVILMTRFYDLWKSGGREPSEALRDAQVWLRDTMNRDLVIYLAALVAESSAAVREATESICRAIQRWPANDRSFSHPFYWGAFSYTGA